MGVKRSRHDSTSSSDRSPSTHLTAQTTKTTPYISRSPTRTPEIKIVHLDANSSSAISDLPAVMKCSLPPHAPLTFSSFEDYDVHYQKTHLHRCSECHRNFPDDHFLNLHIAENHDPINAAKRDRGEKTYACLLPTCDRLCSTAPKRRLHCIDKHNFPRNYDFYIVNDGIDRRTSMLRSSQPHRRRSSTMNSVTSTEVTGKVGKEGERRRTRGESMSGGAEKGGSDAMQIIKDEDADEDDDEQMSDEEHGDEDAKQRTPVKLRGRGGFGRPRGGRGRGRGRGSSASNPAPPKPEAAPSTVSTSSDPMDTLTSSMSALQFIPHSVRVARGRGRGRGSG